MWSRTSYTLRYFSKYKLFSSNKHIVRLQRRKASSGSIQKADLEDKEITQTSQSGEYIQKALKPKTNDPFVKNLFLGNFDKVIMKKSMSRCNNFT